MEQHPVPQNVTTFQFRLIGDMTLKQFGYLAAGAILAYVSYKLPLPFIVTWPLTAVFAILGFGFAFVPVEERPMDVWVFSFFKSIYAPTQYIWQKETPKSPQPSVVSHQAEGQSTATPQQALQAATRPTSSADGASAKNVVAQLYAKRADAKIHTLRPDSGQAMGTGPFAWLTNLFSSFTTPRTAASSTPMPTTPTHTMWSPTPRPVTGTHLDLQPAQQPQPAATPVAQPADEPRMDKLEEEIQKLTQELAAKESGETRILELQRELTNVMDEKNKMEKELLAARQRSSRPFGAPSPFGQTSPFLRPSRPSPVAQPASPAVAQQVPEKPAGPTVKVISQNDEAIRAGMPRLTSFPNIVTGITKDNQSNFLPGVLITVRDSEGVPLRALKTNKLGQFAASTPLPNGTYFIEVEDPRGRYTFDRAQVTLTGGVLPALEITAKSQKELTRDRLAQQIFGDQKI